MCFRKSYVCSNKLDVRSGQLDTTYWRMVRQVRPDHEATLLDGTARSVRYGETLRDRSGQPSNIKSQEVANSQNFIMGSDTTELKLSVESRSFVNRVNDQVRKRQKRISNVAGEGEEHSIIWRMFMAATMEFSDIHGEEYPRQSEFHYEHNRSHTKENVRHICKIGGRTR